MIRKFQQYSIEKSSVHRQFVVIDSCSFRQINFDLCWIHFQHLFCPCDPRFYRETLKNILIKTNNRIFLM
jgi:hypothetical protein